MLKESRVQDDNVDKSSNLNVTRSMKKIQENVPAPQHFIRRLSKDDLEPHAAISSDSQAISGAACCRPESPVQDDIDKKMWNFVSQTCPTANYEKYYIAHRRHVAQEQSAACVTLNYEQSSEQWNEMLTMLSSPADESEQ